MGRWKFDTKVVHEGDHVCDLPKFMNHDWAEYGEIRYCEECQTFWRCTDARFCHFSKVSSRWIRKHRPDAWNKIYTEEVAK